MADSGIPPDWSVVVPLSALMALQSLPQEIKELRDDNTQLRRELDALRTIQSQTLQLIADFKRELTTG